MSDGMLFSIKTIAINPKQRIPHTLLLLLLPSTDTDTVIVVVVVVVVVSHNDLIV